MKKLMVVILLIVLVLVPSIGVASASSASEFDRFISKHNLDIPSVFVEKEYAEDFYYWVMDIIEEDPYHIFAFGHYDYQVFADQIQQAYLQEISVNSPLNTNSDVDQRNLLQYNTYYAYGDSSYNCYSYAINQTDRWLHIGNISGNTWNAYTATLSSSTDMVCQDLISLGYDCINVSYDLPLAEEVRSDDNVIALRLSPIGENGKDFHFMRLDYANGDVWRHKPGKTCILTYNYLPTNDRLWYSEVIVQNSNGYFYLENSSFYYNSDIAYITYNQNHQYTVTYTGNNYHGRGSDQFKHFYEVVKSCNHCDYSLTYWRVELCKGPCPSLWRLD